MDNQGQEFSLTLEVHGNVQGKLLYYHIPQMQQVATSSVDPRVGGNIEYKLLNVGLFTSESCVKHLGRKTQEFSAVQAHEALLD